MATKGQTQREIKEQADEEKLKKANIVKVWLARIDEAAKREKDYRKDAQKAQEIYDAECNKKYENAYNILFSNTETLSPAVYNSLPRPQVRRRFVYSEQDGDPIGKEASTLCERLLSYYIDTDLRDYQTFEDMMQTSVLQALVPGRGVVRFKFDAIFGKQQEEVTSEFGGVIEKSTVEKETLDYETVCWESVPWDRFLHGFARRWPEVPWIDFEHFFQKHEVEEAFGKEIADKIKYAEISEDDTADKGKTEPNSEGVKFAHIHEIWDKVTRKVIFICAGYKDEPIKVVDDPLLLSGFFPMPEPLKFIKRVKSIQPQTLYKYYEDQAEELNTVTIRLKNLIKGLKVRGAYNAMVEGIDKMLTADDNVLTPVENVAAIAGASGGTALENAIMLAPIDKHVAVVAQLNNQRQAIKQVIYEITGIMDIMRGSSVASETLGAQEIKNQWGSLRLKRFQKTVATFARDCLRITAEIGFTKLSPETIRQITGTQLPSAQQKVQMQKVAQQFIATGQQPSPEQQQQFEAMMAQPSLEEVIEVLSNDMQRSYRIDIETNSTVDLEATEDKQDMAELMNAIAQFLNGVAPAVESGIMPFDAAKAMLLGIVRKFRFGQDVEKMIQSMQQPQPRSEEGAAKGPSPEELAAERQLNQQKLAADSQATQQNMQLGQQRHQNEMQKLQMEKELMVQEHAFKMQELEAKYHVDAAKAEAGLKAVEQKAQATQSKGTD